MLDHLFRTTSYRVSSFYASCVGTPFRCMLLCYIMPLLPAFKRSSGETETLERCVIELRVILHALRSLYRGLYPDA